MRRTTRSLLPRRSTHSTAVKMRNSRPYLPSSLRLTASDAAESAMMWAEPLDDGRLGVDLAAAVARLQGHLRVVADALQLGGIGRRAHDEALAVREHPDGGGDGLAGAAEGRQRDETLVTEVSEDRSAHHDDVPSRTDVEALQL